MDAPKCVERISSTSIAPLCGSSPVRSGRAPRYPSPLRAMLPVRERIASPPRESRELPFLDGQYFRGLLVGRDENTLASPPTGSENDPKSVTGKRHFDIGCGTGNLFEFVDRSGCGRSGVELSAGARGTRRRRTSAGCTQGAPAGQVHAVVPRRSDFTRQVPSTLRSG
jgi:hypothetical protein